MLIAFAVMAYGLVAIIYAGTGAPPWDVLHLGFSLQTGLSYGRVIQGMGLIMILISWIMGIRPHLGTVLNMIFIGLFADLIMIAGLVPRPETLIMQLLQLILGTVVFSYGTALYISMNRGTGPRDSLMLALTRLTGLRIGLIRTFIEVTATVSGYLLGGPLGLGTVLFALAVGPLLELAFKLVKKQKDLAMFIPGKKMKRKAL